jgi:transposase-like protein
MVNEKRLVGEAPAEAGTEGGRRPTGVPASAGAKTFPPGIPTANGRAAHPDPQVLDRPVRRRFTKAYKLDILKRADACAGTGQIGNMLRREGLYTSHLTSWRLQYKQGRLDTPASGTAKPSGPDPRVAQLQRENARLQARLDQAELILEIQKKASEILGITLKTLENEGSV